MDYLPRIRQHVTHLATRVGPRGSTTPAEKQAADYAIQVYEEMGLEPHVEPFVSATSAYWPFVAGTALILIAELLYLFGGEAGAVAAAILTVLALISLILELNFTGNPLRWMLPKGKSHNVSVCIDPAQETRQDLVIIGHLDTHRTSLPFRSPGWFAFYSSMTTLTFASVIVLTALYILSLFVDWEFLRWVSLIPSIPVLIIFLLTATADMNPYAQGANDNATGAAFAMTLAERFSKEPLKNTRVWAVNTGCEEVGAYGALHWVNSHQHELKNVVYLTIDNVGGAGCGPCYLTQETLIFPFRSDPGLLKLADEIAAQHPDLGAYSTQQKAAYTEGAIGIRAEFRCLTFVGYTPDNIIPNWHQPTDVLENVDWEVLGRVEKFIVEWIKQVDALA